MQFFGQEEGRVRVVTDTTTGQPRASFKYDYFIKDHLGNTRMVLTDEQESDKYIAATMEVADSAQENLYYSNLSNTRAALPAGYPTDTTTNPNNKVAHLGGATGPKIGPGITLKVMAGDQFSIRVSSWYRLNGATPGAPANPLTDILASLISGVGNLPGGGHPSASALQTNSAPLSSNITQFLSDTGSSINSSKPHAFVNWVLFDNQFNYVAESSGFDQVGSDTILKKHVLMNLPVTKSGYLYIYLSNETQNVDLFFDNLQVTHTRGAMLEEDHYYPFGLTMAGVSDKALKSNYAENKYRYNKGSELQNKEFSDGSGLEMYETSLRSLDPQLGRWWQIDWKKPTDAESPYAAMGNNPILHNDPLGDSIPWPARVLQDVNPLGASNWLGIAGIGASNARTAYVNQAAKIDPNSPTAKQQRTELKEKTRANTPEPYKSAVEAGRPMEGERAKINDPTINNPTKTNAQVNEIAGATKTISTGLVIVGAVQSAITVANSNEPVKETVTEATGWVGASYVGGQFASAGAAYGPYGAAGAGLVGGIIGFTLGKKAGDAVINATSAMKQGMAQYNEEAKKEGCNTCLLDH
ncbi:MAG: hypothetical protein BGO55_26865 [Sphingobacteriales bacterium 50-39]|nr:MAG: hypothetical protein BGO55_26865 [Sphingobacteriales bacterium 50-39]